MKFFYVREWMTKDLCLKGNHLLVFALIYSASTTSNQMFYGNSATVAQTLNVTQKTAIQILKDLCANGLIDNCHCDFMIPETLIERFDKTNSEGFRYVKIEKWMLELKVGDKPLSGNSLIIFAALHRFGKQNQGCGVFQPSFFNELAGISRRTLIRCVDKLESSRLITRHRDFRAIKKPSLFYVPADVIQQSMSTDQIMNRLDLKVPDFETFKNYIKTENLNLSAESTYRKLQSQGWRDNKGKPIRSWKKLLKNWNEGNDDWFKIPSFEDIQTYIRFNGIKNVDAAEFFRYYQKQNWAGVQNWIMKIIDWSKNHDKYSEIELKKVVNY